MSRAGAGAPDDEVNNQTAAWLSSPGVTDSAGFSGFSHRQDGIIPWDVIQRNWPALYMDDFGTFVNVDDRLNEAAPDFDGSHMLYSEQIPDGGVPATHNITVVDVSTPPDGNSLPVYRKVWKYLCFLD